MCPYKVCAFPVPTSLIPDIFFSLLVGLKLGWKFDWMEGQRKNTHIQSIICKSSFFRHNIAIMHSNTVIGMQKVFTDSCADPSAKTGLLSLCVMHNTHNDFVPFSTFHTVLCSLIFEHKQTIFWKYLSQFEGQLIRNAPERLLCLFSG